jgi:quercetin dioxygenase-like cupin family protein
MSTIPDQDCLPTQAVRDRAQSEDDVIVIENLLANIEIPRDGTLSRTLHRDDKVKVVLFGFAGGQELSQHTASVPAIIEILQGDVRVTLDGEEKELSSNSWIFMEANVPHAVYAKTDAVMLLTMLTGIQSK